MYIIIAGGGTAGRNLARRLVRNHDVVIVDRDKQVCEDIYSTIGAVSVHGNANNIRVLRDAGLEKCDVAVGLLDTDASNLAFTVLAADGGVEKILVRVKDLDYESAFLKAGATTLGNIVHLMMGKFIIAIENPRIRRVASLGNGQAEISIITVPEDASIGPRTVSDIANNSSFPDDVVIAGIYDQENDRLVIPRGHQEIKPGNQVFLVAGEEDMLRAADVIMKKK